MQCKLVILILGFLCDLIVEFFFISVGVWVNLRTSRLILRALKLTTM